MVTAHYINAASGISKNGNKWHRLQTMAMLDDDTAIAFDTFVDEDTFMKVSACKPRQALKLKCGVNRYGKLQVVDVIIGNGGN